MPVTEAILLNAGVKAGLFKADELNDLRVDARRERIKLVDAVTRARRIPVSAMYRALADVRGLKFYGPRDLAPDTELLQKLSSSLMLRRQFFPMRDETGKIVIILSDPDDHLALDAAQRHFGRGVGRALADPDAIRSAIERKLEAVRSGAPGANVIADASAEVDSVGLLNEIFQEAYLYRASDIHLEPENGGMRIRLRVDGRLQEYKRSLNTREAAGLMTRLKVLAGMDIAEQRAAQDGGMSHIIGGRQAAELDVRVATVPTRWGERATLRLFGQETALLGLKDLGMPEDIMVEFREAIHRPHGIILVTGPTGSGKTTSLYAALHELNSSEINILTVEDPVEQIIEGVTQVQVSGKIDFAGTLRSFLRHDPDVLLVGEIRDHATADTALKAALTGHLVLSTLHTNDAPSALTRLFDIGCEPYLVASTVIGVVSQRLVRRLCGHCKQQAQATPEEAQFLGAAGEQPNIYHAVGCPVCLGAGYQGRVGLFGAVWVDQALADMIAEGAGEGEIRRSATRQHTLLQDGCHKVLDGLTTIDEVKGLAVGS